MSILYKNTHAMATLHLITTLRYIGTQCHLPEFHYDAFTQC